MKPIGDPDPPSSPPHPAETMPSQYLPPRPEALAKIEHIVVLMLENHSFDHMLGWLHRDDAHPDYPPRGQDFEGLDEGLWNPLDSLDSNGIPVIEKVPVERNGAPIEGTRYIEADPHPAPDFTLPHPDPGEGFKDTNHQLFESYQVPDDYPPEPTNRGFFHAATSCGQVNNKPLPSYDTPTIFNRLEEAGVAWKVYASSPGGSRNPDDSLTEEGAHFSLTRLTMTRLHDASLNTRFQAMDRFYEDAAAGSLPAYAFLEPQYSGAGQNDQHPPSDVRPGEILVAKVFEALRDGPGWEKTLFVVTYDEHGGCYDHVPPPGGAAAPDEGKPAGQMGFRFNRFGVRVPTVLVSPWIQEGTVCRPEGWTPFDHTSVIRTVRNRFGIEDTLTGRDAAAPDLSCALTLDEARTDQVEVAPLPYEAPDADPGPNDLHEISAQVLQELTGMAQEEGESLNDFIHRVYQARFGSGGGKAVAS